MRTVKQNTLSILLVALAILALPTWSHAAEESSGRQIRFNGRLDGNVGSVTLIVELFDSLLGGTRRWGPEQHRVTSDAEGRFAIVIGASGLDRCTRAANGDLLCAGTGDSIADLDQIGASPLYVSITVSDGTTTTVLSPRQRLFPAFHAASVNAGVPVGTVIMWWGSELDIPDGFEFCDGQLPSTEGAVLTIPKPDLRGRFPHGAAANADDVATAPVTGGSDATAQLTSGGTTLGSAQLPDYVLPDTLATGIPQNSGGGSGPHHHNSPIHSCAHDDDGGSDTHYTLGGNGNPPCRLSFGSVGNHNHTISGSVRLNGSGQAHSHTVQQHENRPAFQQLAFIIRVK